MRSTTLGGPQAVSAKHAMCMRQAVHMGRLEAPCILVSVVFPLMPALRWAGLHCAGLRFME
jgi:hypothetical protein